MVLSWRELDVTSLRDSGQQCDFDMTMLALISRYNSVHCCGTMFYYYFFKKAVSQGTIMHYNPCTESQVI